MSDRRVVRLRRAGVTAGLGALVAALAPIWAAHQAASRVRGRFTDGSSTPIPRVAAGSVDLTELLRRRRPVVVEGLIDRLGLTTQPDVAGLRSVATPERFSVVARADHSPYYLYVGDYGAEVDHRTEMDLDEFLTYMFDDGPAPGTCTYQLFGVTALGGVFGRIIDEMCDGIDRITDQPTAPAASGVWIGSPGVVTPIHHDAWPGLLFQTVGTKRVVLFPPSDRPNLYFSSPFEPESVWSELPGRSRDADPAEFPRFTRARRHETVLGPGDALHIPPFWAHEIEALEPNISIPLRFRTRPLDHLNPGFLRPAYEILHRRVAPAA